MKKTIVWSVQQHPNAGQNIQHLFSTTLSFSEHLQLVSVHGQF